MKTVLVCTHQRANPSQPSCGQHGGLEIADALTREITNRGLDIHLEGIACLGQCNIGPNVKLSPEGPFLSHLTTDGIDDLIVEIEQFIELSDAEPT